MGRKGHGAGINTGLFNADYSEINEHNRAQQTARNLKEPSEAVKEKKRRRERLLYERELRLIQTDAEGVG